MKPHQRVDQFMRLREAIEEQGIGSYHGSDFSIVASLRGLTAAKRRLGKGDLIVTACFSARLFRYL